MDPRSSKKFAEVAGQRMAYVDSGTGAPMIFLHGNPTSSYLWRNIISPLSSRYRCIAPDLIGMGDSDKLSPSGKESYTFFEHRKFLDGFIESLRLTEPVILVVHDWGSALGFDWARRNPGRVRGIAYMEAITGLLSWDGLPAPARPVFHALRSEAGEDFVLEQNMFVEKILPALVQHTLSEADLDEYRRPFREPGESRRPTLSWPRQLPIDGTPPEVCEVVSSYAAFMADSSVAKLFVNAEPGSLLVGELRDVCRRWPNQMEVTVRGLHFLQEDSPREIAEAIRDWARELLP